MTKPTALLNTPIPQALFVALMFLLKLAGVRGVDSLRLAYGVGITLLFVAIYFFMRRRGLRSPGWFTLILFLYVAIELVLPLFDFYRRGDRFILNRAEHFSGFAVLTLFLVIIAFAILRQLPGPRLLLLVCAIAWLVGLANELIEWRLYRPYRFLLDNDTLLDLTMNTSAIIVVFLISLVAWSRSRVV